MRRLIDSVLHLHNKAYFWTVYSLGLRLQEGLNLQIADIDSKHGWSSTSIVARGPRTAMSRYRHAP